MGQETPHVGFDGATELRALTDKELKKAIAIIKKEIITKVD